VTIYLVDPRSASDVDLVTDIARRQDPAMAEAYRRHGGSVYGLAYIVLRHKQYAEEITQEVFLDLWQHPAKFDSQRGTLRSFLLTRTHGKSVDKIRSEESRKCREERATREAVIAEDDLECHVSDMTVAKQLRDALAALPNDIRIPIELAYFGGHTYRDVAEMLQTPEGTVKSRIRTGLTKLHSNLAAE
jgi:RNA polymerase sigma-70 factor (ECF subfamily)